MLANMPHLPRHVEPDIARLCDEAVRVALEHVIRNAGGRASDDAIRSLVISHQLHGTGEWFKASYRLTEEGRAALAHELGRGETLDG